MTRCQMSNINLKMFNQPRPGRSASRVCPLGARRSVVRMLHATEVEARKRSRGAVPVCEPREENVRIS